MCKYRNLYIWSLTTSKLKKYQREVAKVNFEIKQAESLPYPDKNLIFQLTEYLEYLESSIYS
jgi:hypothetical protein